MCSATFRELEFKLAWTPEQVEKLRGFAAQGFSASHISALFDGARSRSAILGKLNRMKPVGRPVKHHAYSPRLAINGRNAEPFYVHPKVVAARQRLMAVFSAAVFNPEEFGAATEALNRATKRYHPPSLRPPAQLR